MNKPKVLSNQSNVLSANRDLTSSENLGAKVNRKKIYSEITAAAAANMNMNMNTVI